MRRCTWGGEAKATTKEECCTACQENPLCLAGSFQANGGNCYLKGGVIKPHSKSGIVRFATARCLCHSCSFSWSWATGASPLSNSACSIARALNHPRVSRERTVPPVVRSAAWPGRRRRPPRFSTAGRRARTVPAGWARPTGTPATSSTSRSPCCLTERAALPEWAARPSRLRFSTRRGTT